MSFTNSEHAMSEIVWNRLLDRLQFSPLVRAMTSENTLGAARAALGVLHIDVTVVSDAEEPVDPGSIEEADDEAL